MFFTEVIRVIFECLSLCLVCLPSVLIIIILRVLIKHPNPTTPLEKCSEGDTCVVVSPARIQHFCEHGGVYIISVEDEHPPISAPLRNNLAFFLDEAPEMCEPDLHPLVDDLPD